MILGSVRSFFTRRPLLAFAIVVTLIVVVRALLVAHAHSESIDDEYHLSRGVKFWSRGDLALTRLNDPPFGEGLSALPLKLAGVRSDPVTKSVLHGQPYSASTLLMLIAGWKALLYSSFLVVVFALLKPIYGLAGAWLAGAMLALDPNIAAHVHVGAIDVLGVQGIVVACLVAWCYLHAPTWAWLVLACVCTGVAMTTKHTALILPGVLGLLALLAWGSDYTQRRHAGGSIAARWPLRALHVAAAVPLVLFTIWACTNFDISQFRERNPRLNAPVIESVRNDQGPFGDVRRALAFARYPGSHYVASVMNGLQHVERGHEAFFYGKRSRSGWIEYFPVLATFKVPLATLALAALATVSLFIRRPRFAELVVIVPLVVWSTMIIRSGINIGFRHFLPAYVFALIFTARVMTIDRRGWRVACIALASIAAIDALRWHPNYISYLNWPRERVWQRINDSNLDWGQGLKQIAAWIDAHPEHAGRPIYTRTFGHAGSPNVSTYIGSRAKRLFSTDRCPTSGILIISPVYVVGMYEGSNYVHLNAHDPIDTIGDGSNLVYDLDRIAR